jgi:hypothetical protein
MPNVRVMRWKRGDRRPWFRLQLLFANCCAIALARDENQAALAAVCGFTTFLRVNNILAISPKRPVAA